MQIGPQITSEPSSVLSQQKTETNANAPKIETKIETKTTPQEQNPKEESFYNFLKAHIPLKGAYLTAAGHIAASIAHILNLDSRDTFDKVALNTSKSILSANCLIQTVEAIKENRLWEAISRFLEPLFIIAENRVEDLGLARGIGLGISQAVESQDGVYKELCKQKLGIDIEDENVKEKPTMGQDHDINWDALNKISSELLTGGVGKKRRFMTGFQWGTLKSELKQFFQKFNLKSFKCLFDGSDKPIRDKLQNFYDASGLSHIKTICVGNKELDKGHTTAISGYLMIIGSLLGYMDKAVKGRFYKFGGTLRNIGGLIADVSIFGHPDTMHNLASPFLTVNGIMDILQRFIPSTMTRLVKAVGNISMAFYNVGVAIYLNRSNDKTNKKDEIDRYDTDLAKPILEPKTQKSPAELMAMAA